MRDLEKCPECLQRFHVEWQQKSKAADKLSTIINNCLSTKSISSFETLLLFSYRAFNVAEKSDKSLNKHIKENLSNFEVPQIPTNCF
jgi:hypothetical protein